MKPGETGEIELAQVFCAVLCLTRGTTSRAAAGREWFYEPGHASAAPPPSPQAGSQHVTSQASDAHVAPSPTGTSPQAPVVGHGAAPPRRSAEPRREQQAELSLFGGEVSVDLPADVGSLPRAVPRASSKSARRRLGVGSPLKSAAAGAAAFDRGSSPSTSVQDGAESVGSPDHTREMVAGRTARRPKAQWRGSDPSQNDPKRPRFF